MREGGKILASIMERLVLEVESGKNTLELDKLAQELILKAGGDPAFKGYGKENGNPFPGTICASFNDEVVHGIPGEEKVLKNGDILKIDIGMGYKGFFTDMARTIEVGEVRDEVKKLINVTEECFWKGISELGPGKMLSGYSKAVQKCAEENGFSVVRNLVGHGIGKNLHEDPYVPNYYNRKYEDVELRPGMTLALEPMVNAGKFETKLGSDGWTFKTKDGLPSAHYENTIAITKSGVEILTQ